MKQLAFRPRLSIHRHLSLALTLLAAVAGCADVEQDGAGSATRVPAPAGTPDQSPPDETPEPPTTPQEPEPTPSPTDEACSAVLDYVDRWGAPSSCDGTLATACESLTGILSDAYLAAIGDCIDEDHSPMTCLLLAVGELEPSAAHHELATRFCDECAFGIPACEELFYFEEDEPIGLGIVALPFSDEIVREIAEQCTDGFTCSAELPSCAKDVVAAHVSSDGVLECLIAGIGG